MSNFQSQKQLIDYMKSSNPGQYRNMSDEDFDEFSKTMIEHFLDNTSAQAAAKIYFGKRIIMKITQLRYIIKESIKELINETPGYPHGPPPPTSNIFGRSF